MDKQYIVYIRRQTGTEEIARITGQQVYGTQGEMVRTLLVSLGWPRKTPTEVLYGQYLWAAVVLLTPDGREQDGNVEVRD